MYNILKSHRALGITAALLMIALFMPSWAVPAEDEAVTLQQRGIQRVEAYRDHFRKTGDDKALLPELDLGDEELRVSAERFAERNEWAAAALSRIELGNSMRFRDRWSEAIGFYRQGYDLAKRAGNAAYQAKARIGEARTQMVSSHDLGAAGIALSEAIALSARVSDQKIRFDALELRGELEADQGNLAGAFDSCSRALAVAQEAQDATQLYYGFFCRARVYQKRAEQCNYQREFDPCYEALNLATADHQRARDSAKQQGFEFLAGIMEKSINDLVPLLRQSIDSAKRQREVMLTAPLFNPKTAKNVFVHEHFIWADFEKSNIEELKAMEVPTDLATVQSLSHTLIRESHMEAMTTSLPSYLQKMRQQCIGLGAGMATCEDARTEFIRAEILHMQGQFDAALAAYLKAVDLLEKDRGRLRDERDRRLFLEDKINFYYYPIQHLLSRRRHAEAFDLLQRSRSRALAELLSSREIALAEPRARELNARLLALRAEITSAQSELFTDSSLGVTDANHAKITEDVNHLRDLEKRQDAVITDSGASAPKLGELIGAKPPERISLESLQQLAARERFDVLQYLLLNDQVVVWWIGANGSQARVVFLPRSVAMAKVKALRDSLECKHCSTLPAFNEEIARQLFLFLIQPVRQYIQSDHLVILPHDVLHQLPFQVLIDPDDGKFLGEKFRLSYAPSATILANLAPVGSISKGQLLAAYDPTISTNVGDQGEIATITKLYRGRNQVIENPTEAVIRRQVEGANFVHLSVHGKFNAEEPLLSYLKLKPEGADDGRLTAAEMFGLPLDKTRLVVLSACEAGELTVTNANETLGMIRGLLYAGANALVLSGWSVESQSTALWMETFYRTVQTAPASEAARQALLAVKAKPEYRHPYYWAAFQLVGR